MTPITVTIDLPEDRVQDAQSFGVLSSDVLAELIEIELDRRIMEFVDAEVHAYREEKESNAIFPH